MLEEAGTVIAIDKQFAWIELKRTSSCGQCHVKGCGNAVLAQALGQKTVNIQVANHLAAKLGDKVIIGQKETTLLKSAFVMYLLPLFFSLFFGVGYTLLAKLWQWPTVELFTMISTVIGFIVGLFFVKLAAHKISKTTDFQPVLIRVLPSQDIPIICTMPDAH